MPFADASEIDTGARLEAGLCVVGAGPAGLATAQAAADAGHQVLLIESGGHTVDPQSLDLNLVDNIASPRVDGALRDRRFGGTAWYGRCVEMDPIDFETRPWVPWSGWPVSRAEIAGYYPRAARFLGLPRPDALAPDFWRDDPVREALAGGGIQPHVHLIAQPRDLGQRHRAAVAQSAGLKVLLHATVVRIDVDAALRTVTGLRVRDAGGRALTVRAQQYVLASGGLENTRHLLLLSEDAPGVLGPSRDALGTFYMNHARSEDVARLHLDRKNPAHVRIFQGLTEGYSRDIGCRTQLAIALDQDTQRREQLLNACAFFYVASKRRLAQLGESLDELRRRISTRRVGFSDLSRLGRLTFGLPLLMGATVGRIRRRPFMTDGLIMVEQIEQVPDRQSRVMLGDETDRFGRKRLRCDWRIGHETLRTQRRLHRLLADRVQQQGIGRLQSALLENPDFEPSYGDASHPMGSTRMAADARHGVVDTDSRVHALSNLHVAGSSVFPTGGNANPTLTLVALSLRLGDHLAARMNAGV